MKTPTIWMPLYNGDFDTTTKILTLEQKGALVELLRFYWAEGSLPPDSVIPRLIGISAPKWRSLRDIVLAAFQAYCERIDMNGQRIISAENQARASEHGRKGANARWQRYRERELAAQLRDAMPEHCPSNSPSPSPSEKSSTNREETFIQGSASTLDVERYGEGRASTGRAETPRLMNGFDYIRGRS